MDTLIDLFEILFVCFHLYYLNFCISLYTCVNVICSKLLLTYLMLFVVNSYLLTYLTSLYTFRALLSNIMVMNQQKRWVFSLFELLGISISNKTDIDTSLLKILRWLISSNPSGIVSCQNVTRKWHQSRRYPCGSWNTRKHACRHQ